MVPERRIATVNLTLKAMIIRLQLQPDYLEQFILLNHIVDELLCFYLPHYRGHHLAIA